MSIIAISGRKQSGKDTVAKIIQYLTYNKKLDSYLLNNGVYPNDDKPEDYDKFCQADLNWRNKYTPFKKIAFADKLKDIICLLTRCTREQLEDEEFKNTKLPDEWIRYSYADGFTKDDKGNTTMLSKQCSKERYEEELKVNWQTSYKYHPTYRDLLQHIGTDLFRNQLHNNIWINATFADYKAIDDTKRASMGDVLDYSDCKFPDWIISDLRFPNELEAVEERGGITIRVNRPNINKLIDSGYNSQSTNQHESETALDGATFKYTIDNDGSIEDLIPKIKEILIKEKII